MPESLLRKAARIARQGESAGRAFARGLARVLRDLDRRLPPLLEQAAQGSRAGTIQAARVGVMRSQLRTALTASGYPDLAAQATRGPLDALVARLLKRPLGAAVAPFVPTVDGSLDALRALQEQDLLAMGDGLANALWQATARGIFGSRPTRAILADLQDILDATEPQIQTLYDTNVSIFGRQVEALQAGDDPETQFLYAGPVDEKTRDWCLERVGKVYTRAEIDAMDNGQLDNTFLTGGGYNCRHVWMEVSKFSELHDFDGRLPEVQEQLDEVA